MLDGKTCQDNLEPIMAKEWMMKNWNQYGIEKITSETEFLALLNILQAHELTLEDMRNAVINCHDEFMGFYNLDGGWETMDELYRGITEHNCFFTDEEFISYILETISEMIENGEDPAEEIKRMTYADDPEYKGMTSDTTITKTDDGYVITASF